MKTPNGGNVRFAKLLSRQLEIQPIYITMKRAHPDVMQIDNTSMKKKQIIIMILN